MIISLMITSDGCMTNATQRNATAINSTQKNVTMNEQHSSMWYNQGY